MLAIKQMLLPHSPDDAHNIANALWLYKDLTERFSMAVANGIAKAFNG